MSSQNTSALSKKEEKGKNIQVVVRCRPFSLAERKANSHGVIECEPTRKEITVRTGGPTDKGARKTFTFDMVFGPSAKQIDVYRSVVCSILDEVILGYNCTVFAYGQTGTGKTFTMEGERTPNEEFTWEEDPLAGIIPRTLHQIFEKLSDSGTEFSVKVSLLEIYNEELFDLLNPSTEVCERLQMFDDPRNKRGVIIKGLEEVTVHNKDEVYQILERGAAKRTTASTLMNAYSSRSHSVFSITIHMKETTLDGEELVKIGKLNLVDLAGSENIGRSGAVDKRAREAGNINQSLLTLGRVITALVERTPHIPYRESKLTRILQDSLGGRTKTSIIATISPASVNLEETLSTLDYAHRAKNIMNKPEINQKLTKRALIKEYTEEIERLKRDLAAAREKNGVYLSSENYDVMQSKLVAQEEQITEFTDKIAALEEDLKRVTELFTDSKKELEQCSSELKEKDEKLQETKLQLDQEEFVVSAFQRTEKALFGTASKLLHTVEDSTKDVSGLHAKLKRKQMVEQHNARAKESFAQQMDVVFTHMQKSIDEHSRKHQGMLNFYNNLVGDFLSASAEGFSATVSAIMNSFAAVKKSVSCEVSLCFDEMLKQENLSEEAKANLQKVIEKHKSGVDKALQMSLFPGVKSILKLSADLKQNVQNYNCLAEKMEAMKEDMSSFFVEHLDMLGKLREDTVSTLGALETEHDSLQQDLKSASEAHSQGLARVITCLQSQLNLLAVETQKNFNSVTAKSENLQNSTRTLQKNVQLQSMKALEHVTSEQVKFRNVAEDVTREVRQTTSENEAIVHQSMVYCEELNTNMTSLGQETDQWCESISTRTESFIKQQLSSINVSKTRLQTLHQDVNTNCDSVAAEVTEQIKRQQDVEAKALLTLMDQLKDDVEMLTEHNLELCEQAQTGLNKVNHFLQDELKKDVPTGTTPQRRVYSYPDTLVRTKPRDLLLEQFGMQQQEFQGHLNTTPLPEETVDRDSLEEEIVVEIRDSIANEKISIEENITCQEKTGVPFFQHKKGSKKEKENKATNTAFHDRFKILEGVDQPANQSKLPLRIQN
uniref:Kinesin family member 11 n=3 Tax=Latimeria chalumnae TaxID=7897 RepID=H3B0G7_LATCH|nr:PREDICTED: kinesin-like protein KIF11 isoform X1 [Latimeria chalumnae]XP_014341343.1 PREDICTED: kinesin-like protein KIF11 isoform X1 [Latimeria chalumnae]|eukprot:XP_005991610.1 PREDICTED: kinesin-like protein KIF11 isoform X1 [Latimeria chalumnae]